MVGIGASLLVDAAYSLATGMPMPALLIPNAAIAAASLLPEMKEAAKKMAGYARNIVKTMKNEETTVKGLESGQTGPFSIY